MATKDITFKVMQGVNVLCSRNSNGDSLNISGPCPAVGPVITFAQNSTLDMDGTYLTDSTTDAWRMASSVKITANQTINGLHIIFTREHAQGPNTNVDPNHTFYKLSAKGVITGGGGSIDVTGKVTKVGGPTLTIGPSPNLPSPIDFGPGILATQWNNGTFGVLTGNRILILDLEIVHLDLGATLDLTGGFIKLRSQANADERIEDEPRPVGGGNKSKK